MAYIDAFPRTGVAAKRFLPGVILVAVVTAAAYGIHVMPFASVLSPMITAILVGMLVANTAGVPPLAVPGIRLCGKRLLRAAVALLGLQLTIVQIGQIGVFGLAAAVIALASTFVFTLWLGRLLDVDRGLRYLLAGGVSICGASAAAAVGSAVKARDEDISYAIACITIFGTIAMFGYPLLKAGLGLDAQGYGQWIGLSVHEVAQVVGASFQGGTVDGEVAVVTKLARVVMLAPVVVCVSLLATREPARDGLRGSLSIVPMFIVAFGGFVAVNSLGIVPDGLRSVMADLTPVLLSAALGALGLGTHFAHVRARGLRPLVLAGGSTLFIACVSLLLVKVSV